MLVMDGYGLYIVWVSYTPIRDLVEQSTTEMNKPVRITLQLNESGVFSMAPLGTSR